MSDQNEFNRRIQQLIADSGSRIDVNSVSIPDFSKVTDPEELISWYLRTNFPHGMVPGQEEALRLAILWGISAGVGVALHGRVEEFGSALKLAGQQLLDSLNRA